MITLRKLSFGYPQSTQSLFHDLSLTLQSGFTAIIGPNGSGKSTLLKLLAGELTPDGGVIESTQQIVFCEQRTDDPPMNAAEFLDDWDPEAFELRGRLKVPDEALERWQQLSHGERKRVQIACALWQQPELLLIDEPTNHIDASGRALLSDALERFSGVGVIVSHDRDLLDKLCVQSVWLENGRAEVFPGGYSESQASLRQQKLGVQRKRERLGREAKKLATETARRRERASNADAQRSKRGIDTKDSDARERIDRARLSGKDGTAGKLLRQLDGRVTQNAQALAGLEVEKSYASGIWVAGETSKANSLLSRPAGQISLGAGRLLRHPDLRMQPTDRICVSGDNGSGKSTLLETLLKDLTLDPARVVVMPQEITAEESAELLMQVRALPNSELGQAMSIVRRLGSNPARLLESVIPSPGEVRKLKLALGIVQTPHLLILDEPTNHLDVPAIESLESALVDCPCGLLFVSHDKQLTKRLARTQWMITRQADGHSKLEEKLLDTALS